MSRVDDKLKQRGITLPKPGRSDGNYVSAVRTGNLVFLAGVGPRQPNGELVIGKVGRDLTIEQADRVAKWCAVRSLGNLKVEIGDLDKVVRFVKVLGMVNATPDFTQPPAVISGYSDLIVDVFGEKGTHAFVIRDVASDDSWRFWKSRCHRALFGVAAACADRSCGSQ